MKKHQLFSRVIIFFLAISMVLPQQMVAAQSVNVKKLDDYFTRLKRGIECFIKRKKCDTNDKIVVYQAVTGLLAAVVLVGGGIGLYSYGKKGKKSRENLNFSVNEVGRQRKRQEELAFYWEYYNVLPEIRAEKVKNAIKSTDIMYLEKVLKAGANSNITVSSIGYGYGVPSECHPLIYLENKYKEAEEEEKRDKMSLSNTKENIIKCMQLLINYGADLRSKAYPGNRDQSTVIDALSPEVKKQLQI